MKQLINFLFGTALCLSTIMGQAQQTMDMTQTLSDGAQRNTIAGCISYYGVDQINPINDSNEAVNPTTDTITASVNVDVADSWVHSAVGGGAALLCSDNEIKTIEDENKNIYKMVELPLSEGIFLHSSVIFSLSSG